MSDVDTEKSSILDHITPSGRKRMKEARERQEALAKEAREKQEYETALANFRTAIAPFNSQITGLGEKETVKLLHRELPKQRQEGEGSATEKTGSVTVKAMKTNDGLDRIVAERRSEEHYVYTQFVQDRRSWSGNRLRSLHTVTHSLDSVVMDDSGQIVGVETGARETKKGEIIERPWEHSEVLATLAPASGLPQQTFVLNNISTALGK